MAEPEGLISFPITLPNPAAALAIAGDEQSTALHRLEALTGASIVLRGLDLVIRARPSQLERAAALVELLHKTQASIPPWSRIDCRFHQHHC